MSKKLEGKVAVITGGNSGIGLATAKQFVNEGAYVFIMGRRERELAAAVKEIGRNITAVRADVSKFEDLDRLSPRSSARRAGSTSSSPMPVSGSMPPWARSPRSTTIRSSTST